jgi:hypothetical protein
MWVGNTAGLKLLKNRGKPAAPVEVVQPAAQSLYRLRHIRFYIKMNRKERMLECGLDFSASETGTLAVSSTLHWNLVTIEILNS